MAERGKKDRQTDRQTDEEERSEESGVAWKRHGVESVRMRHRHTDGKESETQALQTHRD